jgi:hypothetical protein
MDEDEKDKHESTEEVDLEALLDEPIDEDEETPEFETGDSEDRDF